MTHANHDRLVPGAPVDGFDRPAKDLGDLTQVLQIVSGFVAEVVADVEIAEESCERMGRIFAGKETAYAPLGGWNTGVAPGEPPGLIRHLTTEITGLPVFPRPEETLAIAFGVLANRVLATYAEEGDGSEWERRSANLVRMFSRILVGANQLPIR